MELEATASIVHPRALQLGPPFRRVEPLAAVARPTVERHPGLIADWLPLLLSDGNLLQTLQMPDTVDLENKTLEQRPITRPIVATGATTTARIAAPKDPGSRSERISADEDLRFGRHETCLSHWRVLGKVSATESRQSKSDHDVRLCLKLCPGCTRCF